MTLIVYFAVPLSWLPFLAQMALFTTGLLILNTVVRYYFQSQDLDLIGFLIFPLAPLQFHRFF